MKYLSSEQKLFYDTNGYIIVNLFSTEEVKEISEEFDRVFKGKQNENLEATWQGDWKNPGDILEMKSIHNMEMHSSTFTRLLLNEKLLDACEDIVESPNLLLHHTKAHLKPPGTGSPFPMHQDYQYFPFEKDSMIAIFISVDSSYPENGGLCIYPGSHKLGPQENKSMNEGTYYVDQEKFPLEKAIPLNLEAGQIVIFSYLLIHGSYKNQSEKSRRMHLIQLRSAEDIPLVDRHKSLCQGLVLRGNNVHKSANINQRH